ncbi:MAG: transposase [candidate division Zixibacteria bacterium]|nr:transposase [candidate division Zixibacteria bacterium]
MTLYKNQYRIESTRLKEWDYSRYGYYFVTICTKDKQHFLGDIVGDEMELSEIGKLVAEEWQKTEKIRDYVKLDEWVIMPNHLHGIIIIQNENNVETHGHASQNPHIPSGDAFNASLRKDNLSNIIRGFKSATVKKAHQKGFTNFAWQSRFYDHIIRNEKELHDIREYIIYNPSKWQFDEENKINDKKTKY